MKNFVKTENVTLKSSGKENIQKSNMIVLDDKTADSL